MHSEREAEKTIEYVELSKRKFSFYGDGPFPMTLRGKIIDATQMARKVILVWRIVQAPLKGQEINDFIYTSPHSTADNNRYAKERLFRFGLYHGSFREGDIFDVRRLIGVVANITLTKGYTLEGAPIVLAREGESEREWLFCKWLRANSLNPLLENTSFKRTHKC